MWTVLLTLAVILALAYWLKGKKIAASLPPGPKGWPIFGCCFNVDPKHPYLTFFEWTKTFGGIYTTWFFNEPMVVVSSPDLIQEVLVTKSKEFAYRPPMYKWNYFLQGNTDIILGNFNKDWSVKKKITTNTMKMYGDGLRKLEVITVETVNDLNKEFLSKGKAFDPNEDLVHATASVIGSLVIIFQT